jgi:CRP-like cAMP-binding protein
MTASLLEVDLDLAGAVPADRTKAAHEALRVPLVHVDAGRWDPAALINAAAGDHLGLLIVRGIVAREVTITGSTATELLGPGDVFDPCGPERGAVLLSSEVEWSVAERAVVAVLGDHIAGGLVRWPQLGAVLRDRAEQRAERLAVQRAIGHISRVDQRLLALLWHLAERYGKVGADGVILPLELAHRSLGRLVGASRSTVTLAVGELERAGALSRRLEGGWLLRQPIAGVEAITPWHAGQRG